MTPTRPCAVCAADVQELFLRCDRCGAALRAGGYQVEALIAQTPHSRLYRARSPEGEAVALKELLFALAPSTVEIEAFEREARLLQSLKHPGIPKLLGFFSEGEGSHLRLYVAQELVEGEDLARRLQRKPFDEKEAVRVGLALFEILVYLHHHDPPVLHRDIKPQNVVMRPDGSVVLVDFGAARDLMKSITHGATLTGTIGYMPFEQLGGTVSPSSDVYALAATLLHLVTGRAPVEMMREGGALDFERHLHCSLPLRRFFRQTLALRRADRPASTREAELLLEAAVAAPAPPPAPKRTEAPRGPAVDVAAPEPESVPEDAHQVAQLWRWAPVAIVAGVMTMAVVLIAREAGGAKGVIAANIPISLGAGLVALVTLALGGRGWLEFTSSHRLSAGFATVAMLPIAALSGAIALTAPVFGEEMGVILVYLMALGSAAVAFVCSVVAVIAHRFFGKLVPPEPEPEEPSAAPPEEDPAPSAVPPSLGGLSMPVKLAILGALLVSATAGAAYLIRHHQPEPSPAVENLAPHPKERPGRYRPCGIVRCPNEVTY